MTHEISQATLLPAKVNTNDGLCQILFCRFDEAREVRYAALKGMYQNQQGIMRPKL